MTGAPDITTPPWCERPNGATCATWGHCMASCLPITRELPDGSTAPDGVTTMPDGGDV